MEPRPRIPPLTAAELTQSQRAMLAETGCTSTFGPYNLFTTLLRHEELFRRWWAFGGQSRRVAGHLCDRDRELLILRTAHLCQASYQWGHHVQTSRMGVLTDEEIHAVEEGPGAAQWSLWDATLLQLVDELHAEAAISDRTWQALSGGYDDVQVIEALFLVGEYHLVAFLMNGLAVNRERGIPGLEGWQQHPRPA